MELITTWYCWGMISNLYEEKISTPTFSGGQKPKKSLPQPFPIILPLCCQAIPNPQFQTEHFTVFFSFWFWRSPIIFSSSFWIHQQCFFPRILLCPTFVFYAWEGGAFLIGAQLLDQWTILRLVVLKLLFCLSYPQFRSVSGKSFLVKKWWREMAGTNQTSKPLV